MDEGLRNLGGKNLEFGIRWPTIRSECTTAAFRLLRRHKRQAKGDSDERGEEAHDRSVDNAPKSWRAFISRSY